MIFQLKLMTIPKKDRHIDDNLNLILSDKPTSKPIKIEPNNNVAKYYFMLSSVEPIDEAFLKMNDVEYIHFFISNEKENDQYISKTNTLESKQFLNFNLGLTFLSVSINQINYDLPALYSRVASIHKRLNFLYEKISISPYFGLFLDKYRRANVTATQNQDNEGNYFLLVLVTANKILKELDQYQEGKLIFTDRIATESITEKYRADSIINDENISWLAEHPEELYPSEQGLIFYDGMNFNINAMSQTVIKIDFDTYENRLIISSLYSIRDQLNNLTQEFSDSEIFPHETINKFIQDCDHKINSFLLKLKILPPFNEIPIYTHKFIGDLRYQNLFELITKWFNFKNVMFDKAGSLRSPVSDITKLFEHYSFIVIVESLIHHNFIVTNFDLPDDSDVYCLTLNKNSEEIKIYYQFKASKVSSPAFTSKADYRPDFLIYYSNSAFGIENVGVIDPKFTDIKNIDTLASDIYFKYGLFLHNEKSKRAIDYVWAIYPSIDDNFYPTNSRNNGFIEEIKPSLGHFSIPISKELNLDFSNFVLRLITGQLDQLFLNQLEAA